MMGRVFISHTSDVERCPDGRSFAQAARDAVNRAKMTPVDMRYFAARESAPADYCRQQVTECDAYIAVVGFRYGSLVPGETVSYTELEFDAATETGLHRLAFLLDEEATDLPPGPTDPDRRAVEGFRQRLRDAGLVVRNFSTADGLELEVFHALSELAASKSMSPEAGQSAPRFGERLRQLRTDSSMTQEQLARAAGVSTRSVSDLERGKTATAHSDTVRLLADAMGLAGPTRDAFETAARGHRPGGGSTTVPRPRTTTSPISQEHEYPVPPTTAPSTEDSGGLVARSLRIEPATTPQAQAAKKEATGAIATTYFSILTVIGVFAALVPFLQSWVTGVKSAILITATGLIVLLVAVMLISKLRTRLKNLNANLLWSSAGWLVAFALAGVLVLAAAVGFGGRALITSSSSRPDAGPTTGLATTGPTTASSAPKPTSTTKPSSIKVKCSLLGRPAPGMTLQLTYHISTSSAVLAGLGAGIYKVGGNDNDYSNGLYDRSAFPLMAGSHSYTRSVAIPANLAPGRYEIDAEIWPPHHVGQNGFDTWADPRCGHVTVPRS